MNSQNNSSKTKETEEQVNVRTMKQLVWIKFKRNKLAIASMVFIFFLYFSTVFAGFISPYGLDIAHENYKFAPPQLPHFFDSEGDFHIRPFVYKTEPGYDPVTWKQIYKEDKSKIYPIQFFAKGEKYKFWGIWETNIHFFQAKDEGHLFLLGTDEQGRDVFSRVLYGARVSLSVGLIGVLISITLGSLLGSISGYYGGFIDLIIQRIIELLRSFPRLPLWMALSAAIPLTWSPIKVYFGIVTLLALINWTGLAREVRGKVLSYTEQDYIMASKASGASDLYIIIRHIIPNTLSHILVVATLSIPGMILGESALSFLGLGIQPPMTSWGVLLQKAQNVESIVSHPWLMTPGFFIIVTVLSFNFLGDGLRDAVDPFST